MVQSRFVLQKRGTGHLEESNSLTNNAGLASFTTSGLLTRLEHGLDVALQQWGPRIFELTLAMDTIRSHAFVVI